MRNIILLAFIISLTGLVSCNNKPEVEPDNHENLFVYPNPTSDRATAAVNLPINSAYTIKVFDEKGNVFLEEHVPDNPGFTVSYPLNLADKPNGKYQIVLKSGDKITWHTLIKVAP